MGKRRHDRRDGIAQVVQGMLSKNKDINLITSPSTPQKRGDMIGPNVESEQRKELG